MVRPFLAAVAALVFGALPVRAEALAEVAVAGTRFVVTTTTGRVLWQSELPGLVFSIGDGSGAQRKIRIDGVSRDGRDAAGEVMLYALSEWDRAGGGWRPLCEADPDGQRLGFPLAGSFDADMRYHPGAGRFLITCTGGAEAKCVRFGYKPWGTAPGGEPLLPYYQACVRLVRADYGGDGQGHTRNGTLIDLFDRIGIQRDETAPDMSFEAVWGPDGAVCVRHTRLPDDPPLQEIATRWPRLAGHVGEACDETVRGLLFTRSRTPTAP